MDFELLPSSPPPCPHPCPPIPLGEGFPEKIHSKEPAHRRERERETFYLQHREEARNDAPTLPPTCLQAQQAGAASRLSSTQLLLTGKCLHLNSSSPLHSWLKIHLKTRFIYILITSAITITLPLPRNCSAACRSLSSLEISENTGFTVYGVWTPIGCFGGNKRNPNGHLEIFCSPKFSLQVHLVPVTQGQDRSDRLRKTTQSSAAFPN